MEVFLSWDVFRNKFDIQNCRQFQWFQLKSCIPVSWLRLVKVNLTLQADLCVFAPHINFKSRIISIDKITSAVAYNIIIKSLDKPPTSQRFFNDRFNVSTRWKDIYLLPRFATVDNYSRIFQYKILNNILFLNDKLYHLNFTDSPLCSLCLSANENIKHLFFECHITQSLWLSLQNLLSVRLPLQDLTLQSAVFGFLDEPSNSYNIANHILLIFKIFIFKNRNSSPTSSMLFARIKSVANIESQLCYSTKQ